MVKLENVGRKFHKFINKQDLADRPDAFHDPEYFWALRNIYMDIAKNEIVGIIGRNGSGKSTLLSIISGTLPVSEGSVKVDGQVSALLKLGAGFQEEFTGRDNIYLNASLLGLKKHEIDERFTSILDFSELGDFINAPLGCYSSGMKMRLGFSVAIHKYFDILVTDEIIGVGDMYFQKKCFQKMVEFKEQGKSMVIATQDMDLVERFCDRVYLLEDGQMIFNGAARDAVEQYEKLLNKKKILSESSRLTMVKETKRWATDVVEWGKNEGTGEVAIKRFVTLNKWGIRTDKFRTGDKINIRVFFESVKEIDNFHFGIAIFREDGVYCYGPNTKFDGLSISKMRIGNGVFELHIEELLLFPGEYYFSVAIWDEKETFSYDYHKGKYKIEIKGQNASGQLLSLPVKWGKSKVSDCHGLRSRKCLLPETAYTCLSDKWGIELKNDLISLEPLKFMNNYGGEDTVFVTGREFRVKIDLKIDDSSVTDGLVLWVGIYRSDGICCHDSVKKITSKGAITEVLIYPKLRLLPGGYKVSAGIFDTNTGKFLVFSHGISAFNIISEKRDHGTIYLDHYWTWRIPSGGSS